MCSVHICITPADGNYFLSFSSALFVVLPAMPPPPFFSPSLRITKHCCHCAKQVQHRSGADLSVVQAFNLLADAWIKQANRLVSFFFHVLRYRGLPIHSLFQPQGWGFLFVEGGQTEKDIMLCECYSCWYCLSFACCGKVCIKYRQMYGAALYRWSIHWYWSTACWGWYIFHSQVRSPDTRA